MKIIFNTDQIYLHGGVEKTMATKANYFANVQGVEVFIVTTEQRGRRPCYPLDEKIHLIDLEVDYNRSKSYFSLENLKKALKHLKKQKRIFSELRPGVVISPNFNFDHYWLPFLNSTIKVIKERHNSYFQDDINRKEASFFQKLNFLFNDWLDKQYDHIVVLNEDEKKYVKSNNAVVIPNSVSIPNYHAELNNKRAIAAGRIAPVKAFDELIKAWKIVNLKFADWELHIYGDDYLGTKKELTKLIHDLDLQNVVFFKETVSDLPRLMTDYSIYGMSSLTECFPMVLLESLSVGLPIVSYDCPNGPRNIIQNQVDGLLVHNRATEELAEKLIQIMADDDKRKVMGKEAKKNAKRFDNETVMILWVELLNL